MKIDAHDLLTIIQSSTTFMSTAWPLTTIPSVQLRAVLTHCTLAKWLAQYITHQLQLLMVILEYLLMHLVGSYSNNITIKKNFSPT